MISGVGRRILVLSAVIGLVFAAAAFGQTWTNVTLTDVNGWKHEGVTVRVEPGSHSLKLINSVGEHQYLEASRVRVVRSGDGHDITKEVLAAVGPEDEQGSPEPSGESPALRNQRTGLSEDSPNSEVRAPETQQARPLYGPRFRFDLGVSLGYGVPSGDWFEGLEGGVSFGTRARLAFTDNLFFGLSVTRQILGAGSELFLGSDVHLIEFYASAGAMTRPSEHTTPIGYAEFGIGLVDQDVLVISAESLSGQSRVSFLTAAGIMIPVSQSVGVDFQGDMRITGGAEGAGTLLGIKVGVVRMFGG